MSDIRPNVGFLLRHGAEALEKAGVEGAKTEAELLLGFCLNVSRTALYLRTGCPVDKKEEESYRRLLDRRLQREPLAYITGEREFWSLPFMVTPDVLIPRPETEFLLEMVFSRRNKRIDVHRCLDICCGSGIIAIVLVRELGCRASAVDISNKALKVGRENSRRHKVEERITFIQADLFSGLNPALRYPLIVANPPYVKSADITSELAPEVAKHEPLIALNGGEDGLDLITSIQTELPKVLEDGGDFFMEIGADQGALVHDLFFDQGGRAEYEFVHLYTDYALRDRVLHIRKKHG